MIQLKDIRITDAFWQTEQELVRTEVIPYQWEALNDRVPGAAPSFAIHNFLAAGALRQRAKEPGFRPPVFGNVPFNVLPEDPEHPDPDTFYGFVFQDTDLYKWLEAVAYSLISRPDPALQATAEKAIQLIADAQAEDGYLDTYYILNGRDKSFTDLQNHHELYCFGHLTEAAVAWHQATGSDSLLQIAERFAACIGRTFGPEKEKKHGYPGHEIAEMALVRLYEETGNEKYLPVIESWLHWVLEEMPRTEYGGLQHCTVWNKHYQQLWCDTLFMVGLFLAKAGVVLKRPELVEEAEYQFLIHIRYLQNKVNGLFYHGWSFDRRHNFAGAFWARGNAWFTASAIELYDITKSSSAAMRMIKSAWRDQVLALWKYQRVNGLYTTLIDVEETYCETSATAAIAYGVLKGVRLGWLPKEQYQAMGKLSADAVISQIDETGAVQGVSGGTGMGHDLEHYKNIIVTPTAYGQGLTFLMLTELMIRDERLD